MSHSTAQCLGQLWGFLNMFCRNYSYSSFSLLLPREPLWARTVSYSLNLPWSPARHLAKRVIGTCLYVEQQNELYMNKEEMNELLELCQAVGSRERRKNAYGFCSQGIFKQYVLFCHNMKRISSCWCGWKALKSIDLGIHRI